MQLGLKGGAHVPENEPCDCACAVAVIAKAYPRLAEPVGDFAFGQAGCGRDSGIGLSQRPQKRGIEVIPSDVEVHSAGFLSDARFHECFFHWRSPNAMAAATFLILQPHRGQN